MRCSSGRRTTPCELQTAANLILRLDDRLAEQCRLPTPVRRNHAYAHQAIDLAPSRPDVCQSPASPTKPAAPHIRPAIETYKIYATKCASCSTRPALLAHAYALQHEMPLDEQRWQGRAIQRIESDIATALV